MSISKVKTVVLIILLLLNAALGSLALSRTASENAIKKETLQSLLCIMEQNGIEISGSVEPDAQAPDRLAVARDTALEQEAAQRLIGESSFADQGAGIHEYSSENGFLRFRSNGEFEAELTDCTVERSGAEQLARELLKALSVEAAEEMEETETEEGYVLSCAVEAEGFVLVNCRVSFVFEEDRLCSISGRRVAGSLREMPGETLGLPTALMCWLDHILSEGAVCKSILGVERGYTLSATGGGDMSLSPVWIVDTDTEEFYVNAVTGEISS